MEQLFPTRFYYWEHCDSARTRSQASKCRGRDCDRNFIWWECDYSESEMENTNVGTKWQKPFKGQLHSIICMYYSIIHSILFVICYPRIADNAMKWNSGLIHHTWFLKKKISTIFIRGDVKMNNFFSWWSRLSFIFNKKNSSKRTVT